MRDADCGLRNCCAAVRHTFTPHSEFRIPNSLPSAFPPPPSALTLIELLVVIVILTTLVGGVIPILSPNNDVRKIQAASRGLKGYITLTQARAARLGRAQGIAFRESSAGSGVALEVFALEVPPPFAGFSTESRVVVSIITSAGSAEVYNPGANVNFKFHPQVNGLPLYKLSFALAGVPPIVPDQLPPRTFRVGDTMDVGGNLFLVVDDGRNRTFPFAPSTVEYLDPVQNPSPYVDSLVCAWINSSGQVAPTGLKRYKINRQPNNSSASPYQLPAGIVIDMQASITEGNSLGNRFPTAQSLFSLTTVPPDFVGIMFSPTGAVDRVIFNGNELTSVSRIVLMLGRIENGGIDPTLTPWVFTDVNDADELKQKQEEINWLNLDSRLLSIVTNSGRAVVSELAFVDPSTLATPNDAADQLEAAHLFGHEMTTAK